MLPIDLEVVAWLAVVANIVVQLVKGLLPEGAQKFIPLGLFVILVGFGLGLAAYIGRDLFAGAMEGFFGAASAIGLYEGLSSLPGVQKIYNEKGWISRAGG